MAAQVRNERNLLFAPGSSSRTSRPRNQLSRNNQRSTSLPTKQRKRQWTVNFVCLADRLSIRVPNANEKQVLHAVGLGNKKIKLDMDDDEEMVLDKLTSDEVKDGEILGFPQLRDCGGFEMMICSSTCRDLTRLDCAWDANSLKAILGGGQSKIYLRPIQTSISTKPTTQQKRKTTLKEKCKMCNEEILLSDLRVHFMLCRKSLMEPDDSSVDDWINISISESEPAEENHSNETNGEELLAEMKESETSQVSTSNSGSDDNEINNGEMVMNQITVHPEHDVTISGIPCQQMRTEIVNICDSESSCEQESLCQIVEPSPYLIDTNDSLDEKVSKIAKKCKETGVSDNFVEILRNLQSGLITGRDLEIRSADHSPEGITNYIMIDRHNLLSTAVEEIEGLQNKLVTLEVQFYNEVRKLVWNCSS